MPLQKPTWKININQNWTFSIKLCLYRMNERTFPNFTFKYHYQMEGKKQNKQMNIQNNNKQKLLHYYHTLPDKHL